MLPIFVRGLIAYCTIFEPAFTGAGADQAVLGGMAEDVIESELVRLPVTGKVGPKPSLEQSPALLQHEFEFFDAGSAVDLIQRLTGFVRLKTVPGGS